MLLLENPQFSSDFFDTLPKCLIHEWVILTKSQKNMKSPIKGSNGGLHFSSKFVGGPEMCFYWKIRNLYMILVNFFSNSSEKRGQTDYGA